MENKVLSNIYLSYTNQELNTETTVHTLSLSSAHCLADIVTLSDGEVDNTPKERALLLLLRSPLYNDWGLGPPVGWFLNVTLKCSTSGEVIDADGSTETGGGSDEPPVVAPIPVRERPTIIIIHY